MYIYQITYILCQLYFSKLDENFQEENLHIVLHSLCTFNIIIDMPGLNLLSCYYYIILETYGLFYFSCLPLSAVLFF